MKIEKEEIYKIKLEDENDTEIRFVPSEIKKTINKWIEKGKDVLEKVLK